MRGVCGYGAVMSRPQINAKKAIAAVDLVMEKSAAFDWLLTLPAVKAQAYFWNNSSRSERKKAILRDMREAAK